MKLSPEQEQALRQWASEGASLSDIQSRLASEFDLHPSYMDVRFLVLDLGVSLAERPKPNPTDDITAAPAKPARAPASDLPGTPYDDGLTEEDADFDDETPADSELPGDRRSSSDGTPEPSADAAAPEPAPASVSVEVSRLAQPGYALNGTVTFSDGVKANWGVTARGELALDPIDPAQGSYQPSREDIRAFQVELRKAITKMGY